MSKQSRKVVYGDELQNKLVSGVEQLYKVAETAYGLS